MFIYEPLQISKDFPQNVYILDSIINPNPNDLKVNIPLNYIYIMSS